MLKAGEAGKCPHCGKEVRFDSARRYCPSLGTAGQVGGSSVRATTPSPLAPSFRAGGPAFDGMQLEYSDGRRRGILALRFVSCPLCSGITGVLIDGSSEYVIWPRSGYHRPLPDGVPAEIRADYVESCIVLPHSPKASAALSRRCLQALLLSAANVKPTDNLARQIESVLESLPVEVAGALDAVRTIGNWAAHPTKAATTGEIVDVEPEEAGWNIEVIYILAEYYYERPRQHQQRMDALNAKLAAAGKKPI